MTTVPMSLGDDWIIISALGGIRALLAFEGAGFGFAAEGGELSATVCGCASAGACTST